MTNNAQKTYALGQSLWYDNIQRRLLQNGELKKMIADGVIYGVTSNPSIFNNAIAKTNDYDEALMPLSAEGKSPMQIYEALAFADIKDAADYFLALFGSSKGRDGYVSLEVNPDLANDTDATIAEAQRLWDEMLRPNLMVKIPATKAGLPAIQRSIANGLNINVTLIFSRTRYREVMEAYIAGLEDRQEQGKQISHIHSVTSFFVSRIDTKVDKRLAKVGGEDAAALMGKIAVANAKLAYQDFKEMFAGERFSKLLPFNPNRQRPLWASTSTKNPDYPDTLYLDQLIGPETVNTVPPQTLDAFIDHGTPALTLEQDLEEAQQALDELEALGISLDEVTQELEDEGVAAFSEDFASLLSTVESRCAEIIS